MLKKTALFLRDGFPNINSIKEKEINVGNDINSIKEKEKKKKSMISIL